MEPRPDQPSKDNARDQQEEESHTQREPVVIRRRDATVDNTPGIPLSNANREGHLDPVGATGTELPNDLTAGSADGTLPDSVGANKGLPDARLAGDSAWTSRPLVQGTGLRAK